MRLTPTPTVCQNRLYVIARKILKDPDFKSGMDVLIAGCEAGLAPQAKAVARHLKEGMFGKKAGDVFGPNVKIDIMAGWPYVDFRHKEIPEGVQPQMILIEP